MSTTAHARKPDAIIRTFRAPDVRSALAAVKASLGPDAVILDTRGTQGGIFGHDGVEVTAAVGIEVSEGMPRQHRPPEPPPPPAPVRASSTLRAATDVQHAAETRLLVRGIEFSLARELVRRAAVSGATDENSLVQVARSIAARRLTADREPWAKGGPRVIALVGPPGVGKTTTIAKLAARAFLDTRAKVALITVDTWRIAASDQLLRYGQIMRMPAHVARDRASLLDALDRTASADLVLIDTAGRSQKEALETQAGLLRSVPGISLFLALAANTGAADLAVIADRYKAVAPVRAVVTKIDEANAPGALLSAFVRLPLPVTALADGQRVPEDIRPTTSAELSDLVFGAAGTHT